MSLVSFRYWLVVTCVALASTVAVEAAVITVTGGDPGEGLLLDPVNLVYAYNIGEPTAYDTVQGVAFAPVTGGGNANISLHGVDYGGGPAVPGSSPNDLALSHIYNAVQYGQQTVTLSNLTAGHPYKLDLLVSYAAGGSSRIENITINGGPGAGGTFDGPIDARSGIYDVINTVRADSSGHITIQIATANGSVDPNPVINGLAVTSVPEPAALGLLGLGGLLALRRRRAVAA